MLRWLTNKKRQPLSRRRPSFFKPILEVLEDRRLLSTGLIQGTVLDQTNAPLAGALLTLTQPGNPSFTTQTQTTGANGTYLFTGLNAGTYQLVETPPTGYSNASNQIAASPVETISSVNSSTINVTIPSSVTLSVDGAQFQYPPGVDNPSSGSGIAPIEVFQYTINGSNEDGSVGQFIATANTGSGFGSPFNTFCIDISPNDFLTNGPNQYNVQPQSDLTGIGGSNVQVGNSGEIAYLYNTFGQGTLSSADAASLQVAIWSLEYNAQPLQFDSTSPVAGNAFYLTGLDPNFPPQAPTTFSDLVNQAKTYINDAAGKSGQALFLAPGTIIQGAEQGMLAPGYANFSIVPSPPVVPPVASISTTQQPATATVGSTIADQVTVTSSNPLSSGDTVTFNLYNNPNATGTPLFTDTEPLTISGNVGTATSASYSTTATGTDYWVDTFNGDANNGAVTSGPSVEPVTITPTTPNINTTQQPASAVVGGSIADKATITGLVNASSSDTVTFSLYNNPNGTGTALFTSTVGVTLGSGGTATATSAGYTTTATGTDYWVAKFNGDSNNSPVTSGTALEPVTITPASPSISTIPGGTVILDSNTALTDSATLSGGYNPGGTITFYLFAPGVTPKADDSNNVYSDTVTVNGNGTYSTSAGNNPGGFIPAVTGTFEWVAVYSGDKNNSSVAGTFGDEGEVVTAGAAVSAGAFATIGFWHNKNGQAVINSFNGGSTSTQLGNWLATNFPNLFGTSNPYISSALSQFGATSLAGLTNAQVATVYEDLWNPSGVTKNTYVQAFAVALGMYADDPSLGFDSTAANYGFKSITGGGGSLTFNVGGNAAAFGVSNNTSLSVFNILQLADANFDAAMGVFYKADQTLTSDLNNVLNGINTKGDV